jgi:hypothetical protein
MLMTTHLSQPYTPFGLSIMRTAIKTMVKTHTTTGQRHTSLTFWTLDAQGNLRGIWVSGSTFSNSGDSILGIRMSGRDEVSSGIFKSSDNSVEMGTIHGKVKARICGNRIFVKIPSGVAMDHEPLPV